MERTEYAFQRGLCLYTQHPKSKETISVASTSMEALMYELARFRSGVLDTLEGLIQVTSLLYSPVVRMTLFAGSTQPNQLLSGKALSNQEDYVEKRATQNPENTSYKEWTPCQALKPRSRLQHVP